jgi:hypothetical protein
MSNDETEFDKLLKEAREWDARDRARHKAFEMQDDAAGDSFASRPRAPVATIGELEKKDAMDLRAGREPSGIEAPSRPSTAIKSVLKTAVSQAKARQANARQGTERTRAKGGGWGWIVWALVIAYFVFTRYLN